MCDNVNEYPVKYKHTEYVTRDHQKIGLVCKYGIEVRLWCFTRIQKREKGWI